MKTRLVTVLMLVLSLTGCALVDPSPSASGSAHPAATADASMPADKRLAQALEAGHAVTVAVASDSTGALNTTWTSASLRLLARAYPDAQMTFKDWDAGTAAYGEPEEYGRDHGAGGITWLNAAVVGSRLDTHRKHLTSMYPTDTAIDVLIINMGHNYQFQQPAEFEADIDLFISEFSAIHPETSIMLTTQNPEFSPVRQTLIDAHAARQEHLPEYGLQHHYPVLHIFDNWGTAAEDQGRSLVAGDGLHPRMYAVDDLSTLDDQTLGASMWAQLFVKMIELAKG